MLMLTNSLARLKMYFTSAKHLILQGLVLSSEKLVFFQLIGVRQI